MTLLPLKVIETEAETALIRRIVLGSADGAPLPGYASGAHITVRIPGIGRRKYSLINIIPTLDALEWPNAYMLGVRRDDAGQGGSKWMHGLAVGDGLEAEPPENDFELAAGEGRRFLLGGGIGITPLITKAAYMRATGVPFRLVYAARTRGEFAFLKELRALAGDSLTLHADDEAGRPLDIRAEIDHLGADEPVYVCGPRPMIKAALAEARALGWPEGRLRFELFYSAAASTEVAAPAGQMPVPAASGGTFEIEIKSSGAVYSVGPDQTILSVLIEAGLDPLHDCDKGECGVCQLGVIDGVPDHKDSILSEAERASNKIMQICVSRAKSARLVLDL